MAFSWNPGLIRSAQALPGTAGTKQLKRSARPRRHAQGRTPDAARTGIRFHRFGT